MKSNIVVTLATVGQRQTKNKTVYATDYTLTVIPNKIKIRMYAI